MKILIPLLIFYGVLFGCNFEKKRGPLIDTALFSKKTEPGKKTEVIEASGVTEILLWHAYRSKEQEALEKIVRIYNEREKRVKIKVVAIPYDAFADKITAAIPRGHGPDLFIFAHDRIGDWAARKDRVIEPIEFWITDKILKAHYPPTISALTYKDSLYGLPLAFKSTILFYNKKLLSTPPNTTDELIELAKKLTDKEKGVFGLVYENANFYHHACFLFGFNGTIFEKGVPLLNSPGNIASYQFARRLVTEGIIPTEVSSVVVSSMFNKDRAAMVINGPWFIGEIESTVDFGVAILPVISATKKRAAPFMGSEAILLSSRSKHKEKAMAVMKYLVSDESALIRARDGRQSVSNIQVYSAPEIRKDMILNTFRQQLSFTIPMDNAPEMRMVWEPMTISLNQAIQGRKKATLALKEAQERIIKLLKE